MGDRILEKDVAITGIGQSEVGRPSNKSAMVLTMDACLEAIADAGLTPKDIDGVCSWPGDSNNGDSFSPVGPLAVKSALGLNVNWFGGGYEGPGPLTGVINGAMAVATGLCRHVIVFRTITEASARAKSRTASSLAGKSIGRDSNFMWQWCTPFNIVSVVNIIAMYAQSHMLIYGTTPEQIKAAYRKTARSSAQKPNGNCKSCSRSAKQRR